MKILLVKTSSLGDIIHSFPVVSYLRDRFPNATIDWVVEKPHQELLEAHPHIDTVFTINTKRWRKNPFTYLRKMAAFRKHSYDLLFDLQGNSKSALITFFTRAPKKVGFGRKTVSEWPNLMATNCRFNPPEGENIRDDYLYLVQQTFSDTKAFTDPGVVLHLDTPLPPIPEDAILVCPGSAWPNKQLSVEQLLQVVGSGPILLLWGNKEEKALAERLQESIPTQATLLDRMPLPALQNLMSRVSLVISMDSMPLHLAATTSTPTLSFFGPSLASKYAPKAPQHRHLQGGCPYGETFTKRCPKLRTCPTGACIKKMRVS